MNKEKCNYVDYYLVRKSTIQPSSVRSRSRFLDLDRNSLLYTMAKHADPAIPDDVEEWLDGFNTFSIYQVLPELIKLWGAE